MLMRLTAETFDTHQFSLNSPNDLRCWCEPSIRLAFNENAEPKGNVPCLEWHVTIKGVTIYADHVQPRLELIEV